MTGGRVTEQRLPMAFFKNIGEMTFKEVAYVVLNALSGDRLRPEEMRSLTDKLVVSESPLVHVADRVWAYEPIHGATLSEYDTAARMTALMAGYTVGNGGYVVCCSVADSTAAMAAAFKKIVGTMPVMLQAAGVLSDVEKDQLTGIVPPAARLYAVRCDERMIERLTRRAVDENALPAMAVYDGSMPWVIARVLTYFDIYRLVQADSPAAKPVIGIDTSSSTDKQARDIALNLGLPVRSVDAPPVNDPATVITGAYAAGGYILHPRSAARYRAVSTGLGADETGIFIQAAHPAKARGVLEPMLGRVIMPPHSLPATTAHHGRYKWVAPTVQAITKAITNHN